MVYMRGQENRPGGFTRLEAITLYPRSAYIHYALLCVLYSIYIKRVAAREKAAGNYFADQNMDRGRAVNSRGLYRPVADVRLII